MAVLADFYRYIVADLPGCPLPAIDQALVDIGIDFCQRTGVWKAWSNALTSVADQSDYSITIPTDAQVRQVECVALGSKQIASISDLLLTGNRPNWQDDDGVVTQATFDETSNVVRLVPTPTIGNETLRFLVSFIPTYNATTLPDVLLQRYARGFSAGVKAELQIQKQVWADPAAAQINLSIYHDAVAACVAQVTRQGMRMPLRAKAVF